MLQHENLLENFSETTKKADTEYESTPKLVRSGNPILFVENNPSKPGHNQWGMRGMNVKKEKSSGVYRIALIGDSVTYGTGVRYKQSFAYLLEQNINKHDNARKVEVLNFAVDGYGLEAYVEILKTKTPLFKPDLIIIGYCLNDPASSAAGFEASEEGARRIASYQTIARYSQFAVQVKYLFDNAIKNYKNRSFNLAYTNPAVLEMLDKGFADVRILSEQENAKLLVIVYPFLTNFDDYKHDYVHALLAEMLSKHNIANQDLYSVLAQAPAESLRIGQRDVTHPNEKGHQLIADYLTPIVGNYVEQYSSGTTKH